MMLVSSPMTLAVLADSSSKLLSERPDLGDVEVMVRLSDFDGDVSDGALVGVSVERGCADSDGVVLDATQDVASLVSADLSEAADPRCARRSRLLRQAGEGGAIASEIGSWSTLIPRSHPGALPRSARPSSAIDPHFPSGVLPRLAEPGSSSAGRLIVFEGIDGSGKTEQVRELCRRLDSAGIPHHATREPSDGPIGLLIREILVGRHRIPGDQSMSAGSLALLFAADRMDHLQREVEPALARGEVVVSDRWYHSSLAYQGTASDVSRILLLNEGARSPDLTILLCVDPVVAAARRVASGRRPEIFDDDEEQRRIFRGYGRVADILSSRGEQIRVVDGSLNIQDVSAIAWDLASSVLLDRLASGRRDP